MRTIQEKEYKRHMNILCSCDTNYVPCCGIMLTSLFENNKDSEINVYIFTDKAKIDGTDSLQKLADQYCQRIQFVHVDNSLVELFPLKVSDHVTKATYYRLFAADLLPAHVEKVLYLDCDIIVNKSLSVFYDADISDYSAAVVQDSDYFMSERNQLLELVSSHTYFNAGVLLLNLNYWRIHNLKKELASYVRKYKDKLHFHDQDILNIVLQGTVLYFPLAYNFQTYYLLKSRLHNYDHSLRMELLGTPIEDIVIVHYTAPVKPWNCWHFAYPFDSTWQYYQKISSWKDWRKQQSLRERLQCRMLAMLCKLGLKQIEV